MSLSTRESVATKAHRLVQSGRVTWAQGVAVVAGDHDTHVVRRQGSTWSCSCPWGASQPASKPCSHVLAAALTAPASPAPAPSAPVAPRRPVRRLPRNVVRQDMLTRTDDPADIAALVACGYFAVVHRNETGYFAVCEEVVLNLARRQAERRYAR